MIPTRALFLLFALVARPRGTIEINNKINAINNASLLIDNNRSEFNLTPSFYNKLYNLIYYRNCHTICMDFIINANILVLSV